MTAVNVNNNDFNWDKLLDHFKYNTKIIPVIGPGLYRVEIDGEGNNERLLYDYLAEQVLGACGVTPKPDESLTFAKACFEFLKKNSNYPTLSFLLKEILKDVRLIHPNALWKLARIKSFNLFINTAYDNSLSGTLKTVRHVPTEELYYTLAQKELGRMDLDLFNCLRKSACTVICQVFGNINENIAPAFTDKDILETTVEFLRDLVSDRQNNKLFWKLKNSSLLFIGCGFDDWLFRFFIHTFADEPQRSSNPKMFSKFVVDNFANNKVHFNELPQYLKNYGVEVFYSLDVSDFVDKFFDKVEANYPEEIIQPPDFPGKVFISFEGKDRPAARRLAENLRNDGIDVWLDESKFKGGDNVDKTIVKAIDKCPAFIPLISRHSKKIKTNKGGLKYHIREWEQAHTRMILKKKEITVIPVKIDNTGWNYEKFKGIYHYNIPGGNRVGDYDELRGLLSKDVQKNIGVNNEN